MSVEAITWALRQPIKQSSTKFILVVLANCASAEHANAWPSVAYLSESTGQDRKTVMANLQRLQDWGLIEDTGKRVGDTRQIVVYKLICGPDLFIEQSQKRNSPKNGTVPKTEQSRFSAEQSRFSLEQSQKRDTEPSITNKNQKDIGQRAALTKFDQFWKAYPKRVKRKPTLAKWKAKGLDAKADVIIADVKRRMAEDGQWLEGFIPDPLTYVNQERWTDELQPRRSANGGSTPTAPPPPAKDWRKPSESKLDNALAFIRQQHAAGAFGEGEEADCERERRIADARAKHGQGAQQREAEGATA